MSTTTRPRAPRTAVLVHNDCANDARVLKESASLAADGARVRIIAVERRLRGRAAGLTSLSDLAEGLELLRVPEFALERVLPARLRPVLERRRPRGAVASASVGSPAPSSASSTMSAGPTAPVDAPGAAAGSPGSPALPVAVRSAGRRLLADLASRAYGTLALGTYWLGAIRATRAFAPDVIHANDANTLVPALAVRALSPQPVAIVYDAHELWRHRNVRPGRVLAPLMDVLTETLGVRGADGIITVSGSIADWMQRTYDLPERPALVRNIPPAAAPPRREDGRLRTMAQLADTDRVIAYGGLITRGRGIAETIAALPLLPSDVHFVLLGYGEEEQLEAVRHAAVEHGVADRVHLVGAVPPGEVTTALADGDVAVVHVRPICLSYRFALPNKLFESIRAGLPVAVADLPDMRAVVEEHGVGEVFDGEDPADLARTLERILADPSAYRRAARAAADRLTWEQEAVTLLDVHRRALAARRLEESR